MKKVFIISVLIGIFGTFSICSMEEERLIDFQIQPRSNTTMFFIEYTRYCEQCVHNNQVPVSLAKWWKNDRYEQAKKYNTVLCSFVKLPFEILFENFSCCYADIVDTVKVFEESIKNIMNLSITCTGLNVFFSENFIAELCKKYEQTDKNKALATVLGSLYYDNNYKVNRLYLFMLLYAGADVNTQTVSWGPLLAEVAWNNDLELADVVLKYGAQLNTKKFYVPVFFSIKSRKMAEKFVKNKDFDIQAVRDDFRKNVLWCLVGDMGSSDLVDFYLEQGVKADGIDSCDGKCILHSLAWKDNFNNKDCVRIAELLLQKIPHLINTLNSDCETPLDVAQASWKFLKSLSSTGFTENISQCEQVIQLYKKYGGHSGESEKKSLIDKYLGING